MNNELYNPKVSVIITALDEEENISQVIGDTLKAFEDFSIDGEVIFVNDGSKDRTGEVVEEAFGKNKRVMTIVHDSPRGVGGSFWEGVDISRSNIVAWLPGDNQTNPWKVLRYHALLEHVDLVVPFIFNSKIRPRFRRALSVIYRFIINHTFSTNFNYTNGSILYRKSIFGNLSYRSSSFFFQTDILIRLTKKGCLFAEVPFRLDERDSGSSKAVSFPSFLKVATGYIKLVRDFYWNRTKDVLDFPKDSQTTKRHGDSKSRLKTD